MLIGIIGAMQEEIKLLSEKMEIKEIQTIGMRDFYIGELFDKEVVLVFSRCGKVAAASTVTTLIEIFKVDLILFTGVAGGADKALNIGDIVIADKLVQHDMDASAIPGFRRFEIPLLGVDTFESSEKYISLAKHSSQYYISKCMHSDVEQCDLKEFNITTPNVIVGTVTSGDIFVADNQMVQDLCSQIPNLKCIEMEGAAVAQVCYEHKVDFVVFRVISDKADDEASINFPKFIEKAASHFTCGIIEHFVSEIK